MKKVLAVILVIIAAIALIWALQRRSSGSYVPSTRSTESYIRRVERGDERERVRAIDELAQRGERAAIPALTDVVKNETGFVRAKAAHALGKIFGDPAPGAKFATKHIRRYRVESPKEEAAVKELLVAATDPDQRVCRQVCRALARINDERAVPVLAQVATDKSTSVDRLTEVAWALGYFWLPEAEDTIWKLMYHDDYSVRETALNSLARIASVRSLPKLWELLKNPTPRLNVLLVRQIIAELTGKPMSELFGTEEPPIPEVEVPPQ